MTALFDEQLLVLARSSVGRTTIARPTVTTRVANPLCGDGIELALLVEAGVLRELSHRTSGCAILRASAALLSEHALGLRLGEVRARGLALEDALLCKGPLPELFGAFAALRYLPSRRRCALLPWSAAGEALDWVI